MFKTANYEKRPVHIVNQFRHAILSGALQPGQALPAEKDLITKLGVSKHTLREALRALEAMGMITIKRGAKGGPVVKRVDIETARASILNFLYFNDVNTQNLSEVRKIIEVYVVRDFTKNLTDESKKALLEANERCLKKFNPLKLQGIEELVAFHILIARHTGNPIIELILDFANNLLVDLNRYLKPGEEFKQMVHQGRQKVVDAIVSGDPDAAAECMLQHINDVEEALQELRKCKPPRKAARSRLLE